MSFSVDVHYREIVKGAILQGAAYSQTVKGARLTTVVSSGLLMKSFVLYKASISCPTSVCHGTCSASVSVGFGSLYFVISVLYLLKDRLKRRLARARHLLWHCLSKLHPNVQDMGWSMTERNMQTQVVSTTLEHLAVNCILGSPLLSKAPVDSVSEQSKRGLITKQL